MSVGTPSTDTITPVSPMITNIESIEQLTTSPSTQTLIDNISPVTTVLPIPPVNIDFVPNPDITRILVTDTIKYYDYLDRAEAIADMLGAFF
jgi:hypothetical protein